MTATKRRRRSTCWRLPSKAVPHPSQCHVIIEQGTCLYDDNYVEKEKKEKATPPIRRRLSLRRPASEILIKKESDKYSAHQQQQQWTEGKGPSTSATSTRKRKAEDPPSSPSSSSSSSARFRGAIRDTSKPLMTSMIKSRATPFRHLEVSSSSPSHDEDEENEENEEDDDISPSAMTIRKSSSQPTKGRKTNPILRSLLHHKHKERPSDKGKVLPDIKKPKQ